MIGFGAGFNEVAEQMMENIAKPQDRALAYGIVGGVERPHGGEIAMVEAAFGQGATMMAPFHIARLTAAIANHGHVLQPFIVQKVEAPEKRVLTQGKAEDYLIRVNRQPVNSNYVIQEGDRVSITPTKIEGAAIARQ